MLLAPCLLALSALLLALGGEWYAYSWRAHTRPLDAPIPDDDWAMGLYVDLSWDEVVVAPMPQPQVKRTARRNVRAWRPILGMAATIVAMVVIGRPTLVWAHDVACGPGEAQARCVPRPPEKGST